MYMCVLIFINTIVFVCAKSTVIKFVTFSLQYVDNKIMRSGINGFLHRGEEEHKGGPIACNNVTPTN